MLVNERINFNKVRETIVFRDKNRSLNFIERNINKFKALPYELRRDN